MTRAQRIALLTAVLVVLSALFGAAAAAGALAIGAWLTGGWSDPEMMLAGTYAAALVGGALGGALGPLGAWGFLRRVPLGLAFLGPTLGAMLGGVGAWCAGAFPVGWAVAGFAVAVLGLRRFASVPAPVTLEDDGSR